MVFVSLQSVSHVVSSEDLTKRDWMRFPHSQKWLGLVLCVSHYSLHRDAFDVEIGFTCYSRKIAKFLLWLPSRISPKSLVCSKVEFLECEWIMDVLCLSTEEFLAKYLVRRWGSYGRSR